MVCEVRMAHARQSAWVVGMTTRLGKVRLGWRGHGGQGSGDDDAGRGEQWRAWDFIGADDGRREIEVWHVHNEIDGAAGKGEVRHTTTRFGLHGRW
jgi:hypothetical protein